MALESVTDFQAKVLFAVQNLGGNAYPLTICDEVTNFGGRTPSLGAVYVALDELERKGYLASALAPGGSERGYRPKRFYELTPEAREPVIHVVSTPWEEFKSGWQSVPWGWERVIALTPAAFGFALAKQSDVPWPQWLVALLAVFGGLVTGVLCAVWVKWPELQRVKDAFARKP